MALKLAGILSAGVVHAATFSSTTGHSTSVGVVHAATFSSTTGHSTIHFEENADPKKALGIDYVSSVGPANPLPSFFFQGNGQEGSGSGFEPLPRTGTGGNPGIGERKQALPSDWLNTDNNVIDAHVWRDPDEDGVCRDAKSCYSPDMRVSLLPYTRVDLFGCERLETGNETRLKEQLSGGQGVQGRLQEDLKRSGKTKPTIPVVTLETEELKLSVTPSLGGKLFSVLHKKNGQDFFMTTPAIQPVDFGMRKGWIPGGVEWNWTPGNCGHAPHTLDSVYVGVVEVERPKELRPDKRSGRDSESEAEKLQILRVYDYDRVNNTVWQVDLFADDYLGGTVFAHVSIHNPNKEEDLNGYWWTNVAQKVTVAGNERIILPASYDTGGAQANTPWPYGHFFLENAEPQGILPGRGGQIGVAGKDRKEFQFSGIIDDGGEFHGVKPEYHRVKPDYSWTKNRPVWQDYFARLCDQQDILSENPENPHFPAFPEHCKVRAANRSQELPYIGHVLEDGWTTVHGHRGLGTKFYMHSSPGGEVFVQYFMAGVSDGNDTRGEKGLYLEAQTGRAFTQSHVFGVPKNKTVQWTEWFRGFQATDGEGDRGKGDGIPSKKALQHPNYTESIVAMENYLDSPVGMAESYLQKVESFLEKEVSRKPVKTLLREGTPWAALEEKRMGSRLVEHLDFSHTYISGPSQRLARGVESPEDDVISKTAVKPYLDLLKQGKFSEESINRLPGAFLVSEKWRQIIEKLKKVHGTTWLHLLLLGVIETERGYYGRARRYYRDSIRHSRLFHGGKECNPIARRNLALLLLERRENEKDGARELLEEETDAVHNGLSLGERQWELMVAASQQAIKTCAKEDPVREPLIDALLRETAELRMDLGLLPLESSSQGENNGQSSDLLNLILDWGEPETSPLPPPIKAPPSDAAYRFMVETSLQKGEWREACKVLDQWCWPLYFKQPPHQKQLYDAFHKVLEGAYREKYTGTERISGSGWIKPSELQKMRRKWGIPVKLGGMGSHDKCGDLEKWVKDVEEPRIETAEPIEVLV